MTFLAALVVLLAGQPASAAGPSPVPSPAVTGKCPPGLGVGLLQFPAERKDDPRARTYVIDHVAPGASFSRKFQVCNGTNSAVTARLYAGAAAVQAGQFALAAGDTQNAASRAIRVDPPSLTLAAGAVGVATAVFSVPRDAQAGEQYAVIYAEVTGTRGGKVVARSRAGIRVYLDIGQGGEQPSDFRIDSLQAGRTSAGLPQVTALVTNTGARALDLVGELQLSNGPGALSAGPFPATRGTTVGVGQTEQVVVPVSKQVTGGPWTADLTLHGGLLDRRAAATITFPDAAGAKADTVRAIPEKFTAAHPVLLPVAIGLIGLLLLLLITVGYVTSRRKARHNVPS